MSTTSPTFGELLRYARKAAGMSQRALAQFLEISAPYLSDVENGNRAPLSPELAVKACHRLGVSAMAETRARAVSNGYFVIEARADHQPTLDAGSILSLAWYWLGTEDLMQIERIARAAMEFSPIDPDGRLPNPGTPPLPVKS